MGITSTTYEISSRLWLWFLHWERVGGKGTKDEDSKRDKKGVGKRR